MASVAERFGMSVQRLIDLNADLADVTDDNFIKDGEERVRTRVCLACVAHSCFSRLSVDKRDMGCIFVFTVMLRMFVGSCPSRSKACVLNFQSMSCGRSFV
jgi:hypothetical protein